MQVNLLSILYVCMCVFVLSACVYVCVRMLVCIVLLCNSRMVDDSCTALEDALINRSNVHHCIVCKFFSDGNCWYKTAAAVKQEEFNCILYHILSTIHTPYALSNYTNDITLILGTFAINVL